MINRRAGGVTPPSGNIATLAAVFGWTRHAPVGPSIQAKPSFRRDFDWMIEPISQMEKHSNKTKGA
jgi:hypothetical protein